MGMSDPSILALAFVAGLFLGTLFTGGLWWTVRKGTSAEQPALWFIGSFALRTTLVLAGFYAVSAGRWDRMASALFGFLIARAVIVRLTRPTEASGRRPPREIRHAPYTR